MLMKPTSRGRGTFEAKRTAGLSVTRRLFPSRATLHSNRGIESRATVGAVISARSAGGTRQVVEAQAKPLVPGLPVQACTLIWCGGLTQLIRGDDSKNGDARLCELPGWKTTASSILFVAGSWK